MRDPLSAGKTPARFVQLNYTKCGLSARQNGENRVAAGPKSPNRLGFKEVNDIVFEIRQDADGGFSATQGDTWDELRANVKEAVKAFYFDGAKPGRIRLHLVRDKMLALG